MNSPLRNSLDQLFHLPNRSHPASIDGLLRVNEAAADVEMDVVSLANKADFSPLQVSLA